MPATRPEEPLDEVNRRLLAALHDDPRISMSALARTVDMSAPAVTERVQRLVDAGVITGFRMEVDPAALGLPVSAFTRIRPFAGQLAGSSRSPSPSPRSASAIASRARTASW